MRTLRFDGETPQEFRRRVEFTARYTRLLIDAALDNQCIQSLIADPEFPFSTEAGQRSYPTVRIEFEEAIAIAGIGEGLQATRNKHWGDGPYIHPLRVDDPVDPMFILYIYKENSRYNRRFEQRRRLKELLGKRYRTLVERAKYHRHNQAIFLENLKPDERRAIERIFKITARQFWRAARGKVFLTMPPRLVQLPLPFPDEPLPYPEKEKP